MKLVASKLPREVKARVGISATCHIIDDQIVSSPLLKYAYMYACPMCGVYISFCNAFRCDVLMAPSAVQS